MIRYIQWMIGVFGALGGLSAATAGAEMQNMIVIGWDGVQREHLQEMIARNEVPHMMRLVEKGALIDIDITNGATDTKAGWAQILTGYHAETTGVYSNTRYQPIPAGYSVFERLEAFFGAEQIDTVAIIGKKGNIGNKAPKTLPYERWLKQQKLSKGSPKKIADALKKAGAQLVEESGKRVVSIPGNPWYHASSQLDLFVNGLSKNEVVGQRALDELERHQDRRFFFFVHFADPDHSGHAHGENSQEYTDGIKSDDEWTGKILAKLDELNLSDKTLVYIVTDHGFDEGLESHQYAPYVFLAANDPSLIRDGDRTDIAPTILKRFGLDVATIQPALAGVPLNEPAERKIAPATPPQSAAKRLKTLASDVP